MDVRLALKAEKQQGRGRAASDGVRLLLRGGGKGEELRSDGGETAELQAETSVEPQLEQAKTSRRRRKVRFEHKTGREHHFGDHVGRY